MLNYARQHAWLFTDQISSDGKTNIGNRASIVEVAGADLPLPAIECAQFLQWFFDIGPILSDGEFFRAIRWAEIADFQRATGIRLKLSEARLMIAMSGEYCVWMGKAKDQIQVAPWNEVD